VNKSELVEHIARQADISKAKARIALDTAIKGLGAPEKRRSVSKSRTPAKAPSPRFKPGKLIRW
jgi:hypothetical protein